MQNMRWPRKNDPASIDERREAMGLDGGLVTSVDLEPFAGAAESLVGVAVIPVSAVPVEISLGAYELSADGDVVEHGRETETVHVPLAHTEGGLTASLTRGALAAGAIRTYVLYDRITRASCFVCKDAGEAEAFLSYGQSRRVLRTTADDLEALSWAGTHGSVASGMQSVAFTPASAVAAIFAATGQDLGMVGTSSMAHGAVRRVDGGLQASI